MTTDARTERDFMARDPEERQALTEETWCDNCQALNLGMDNAFEYELFGLIFVEGTCRKCGNPVLTEITDEDF